MIKYLSIENFYSIKNESVVEFDLNKSKGDFIAHPTLGFAGTNASGKTNFIKAINFLVWFIGQSFFTKESKLPYEKFVGLEELPTKFSFIFCIDEDEFGYELEINGNKVLNEILSKNNDVIYNRSLKNVIFGKSVSEFSTKDLKDSSSVISYATNFDSHIVARNILEYLRNITINVNNHGHKTIKFEPSDLIILSEKESIKKNAIKIIQLADIGITDFFTESKEKYALKDKISEEQLRNLEKTDIFDTPSAFFKHKIGDNRTDFTEEKESSGTLQLFALMSMILPKLETGGLIILDEIETNLHQNLVAYLIGLFQNPEVNKGSAQLIFTFHNSLFMDILAPEQLWFAEKNNKGETELFCAANFVDIEEIHKKSLEKLYRIGRFGAKPKGI